MKLLSLPVFFLAMVVPAATQLDGAFTLRSSDKDDRVSLNLQCEDGRSNFGRMVERSAFTEIVRAGDRVTFNLRREPGTFAFEGRGTMDRASGSYLFTANPQFVRQMETLGYRELEPSALFVLALDDLTVAKVKQLEQMVSNKLDTGELVRLINHGAGHKYIQAMTDLGFKNLTSDEYRRARDHGVSESFVREMADLGMKLSLEELIRTRDHGVTPEYVRAMRDAGFKVSHDELVRARDHGVSADFLGRMRGLGYDRLSLDEYIRMRDHGVTPDFVESMKEVGYTQLTAGELVRLRDHGVSASYVRRVKDRVKESPSVEEIIRMRSRGEHGR